MDIHNSTEETFSPQQMLYIPPFPPPPPSTWGAMKRCSGWADVFSTIWTLSQISSALTSFTGHGWLRFRGNDKTSETTVRPSLMCRTVTTQKSTWIMDAWLGSVYIQCRLVKSRRITTVTPDCCCLWERLVLVHMFSIKRGCIGDVMWDDRTHAVVKDSIALSEEDRINGLQTGKVWILDLRNRDSECLLAY